MNEIVRAFNQNKAAISAAESREKQLTGEITHEEKSERAAFERVYEEGRKLTQETELIASVLYLFPDRLSLQNGCLCFRNSVVKGQKVCAPKELDDNIHTFLTDAYAILHNRDELDARCEKLASLHQGIMQYIYHREAYEAEYLERILNEKKAELSALRERLNLLRKKEHELLADMRSAKSQTEDSSVPNHRLVCQTTYAENIVIPLGHCDFRTGEESFPCMANGICGSAESYASM